MNLISIFIYNMLYISTLLIGLPYFLFHYLRKKTYRRNFLMRLGFYPRPIRKKLKQEPFIWFHAVSVGEVNSTAPLIESISNLYPDHNILLSTTTPTGLSVANRLFEGRIITVYFPLDFFFLFNPFLRRKHPSMAIFIETEIWPNSIAMLKRKNIPMFLVNGRISDTSFNRYRLIRPWFKELVSSYKFCFMQSDEDMRRITELGLPQENACVFGNLKYEACFTKKPRLDKASQRRELGIADERTVIIGGSTHPGEEEILVRIYSRLCAALSACPALIVAPRNIERVAEITEMVVRYGFTPKRYSAFGPAPCALGEREIIILDTIGDLFHIYEAADIVFVGKSLAAHGGQNMVEPAVLGKALLFGPYTENFNNAVSILLGAEAAIEVQTEDELQEKIKYLLDNPQAIAELSAKAKEAFAEHAQTTDQIVRKITAKLAES